MTEKKKSTGTSKKLWGGRFEGQTSEITERLSASIDYDKRLYRQDIRGSLAHAAMLGDMGILDEKELEDIREGLAGIKKEIEEGSFPFSPGLEDIHMNIEARLTERIGDAGRKLHTARSRNDQIALDIRMYVRDEGEKLKELLVRLTSTLAERAGEYLDLVMPGYTHLQVAQPVRFSHHLMAYAWMFLRDLKRLKFAMESADALPLGSGALAGVNYENDREFLRKELGFTRIIENSMDAVSDRDFLLDFLYQMTVCAMHLSRLSEELVLWSTGEFAFIRLSDELTTGSSIMPQKRNPDLAELIRGKTGRVYGNLHALLTTLKGLPMTYNRDLQEDKEPLFDSLDTLILSLEGMTAMISTLQARPEAMEKALYGNFSTATDLADYLVRKGVPFRSSHEIVGRLVRYCEETGSDFFSLTAGQIREFTPAVEDDVVDVITPTGSTERKTSRGSTARREVERQIERIRTELSDFIHTA
jgi:argininosuccinate lyase